MTALASAENTHVLAGLTSDEVAGLLEVSQGLTGSLDCEQVLARVAHAACELLETEMSTVLMLDEEGELLTVAAFDGVDPSVASQLSTPVGENLAGLAAQFGHCVRSSDIALDARSSLGDVCEGHIRSAMLAPMKQNGCVLGVLGVQARESREFTQRDERLLCLLAKQGATAIETARLYAVELERVDQLNHLLARLNAQNDRMRRGREAHDRLTDAALEGLGLASLLHVLVELVPAPIVLTNQFGSRLGAAAPPEEDRLEELWSGCAGSTAFAGQLQRLRANAGLAEPARVGEAGFWRTVVVVAAGELLGTLAVLDHSQIEELHMVVLQEAANVIATEMLRERSIAEAEARATGDLVRMLVSNDRWGEGAEERAALLGHDLTGSQCVVAVGVESNEEFPEPDALASAARRSAARTGLRSLVGESDGTLAVLLTAGDRALSRQAAAAWIVSFRKELGGENAARLTFGVSTLPCEPGRFGDAFQSARQALAVCRLGSHGGVTYFEDVQLIATLIDITNHDAVERYIEQTVGKLREYDDRKHTDLAHTLETYLDCSGVARHAAKALFLHPHSLRYRLRRIGEIQSLDLADPMTRLSAHLALKLCALVTKPA